MSHCALEILKAVNNSLHILFCLVFGSCLMTELTLESDVLIIIHGSAIEAFALLL